jgi:regulator of nucleoside diphosphate kinase
MQQHTSPNTLPKIVVSEADHDRLVGLAMAIMNRSPELAESLLDEMERARVVAGGQLPANVVRMGSTVEYRTEDGQQRRVTLVYPADADIAAGRISILTPVGAALIGLAEGQSISWTARDGRNCRLTVLSVTQEGAPAE